VLLVLYYQVKPKCIGGEQNMNLISLYIHIPFCEKKCYYCDFSSYGGKKHLIDDYITSLKKEIVLYKSVLDDYKINTIFFGGGTPSILSGNQIAEIMETVDKYFSIEAGAEVSMEANPGTLTYDKLKRYYESGINRLSIGLQACQNNLLRTLGRIHSFENYIKNLEEARNAGFSNINTDLMFSLPGQKKSNWEESLEKIVSLEIPHISAYSLIVEEETPFYDWVKNRKILLPDEEVELKMYHYTIEYLEKNGYNHYEISNFAKPGFQCKHNLIYWQNKSYIGLGSGAHSYFNKKRFSNVNQIEEYISLLKESKVPIENETDVSIKDEISETMFLGLRMMEGVSIEEFTKRFNISPFEIYKSQINKFKEQNLLYWDEKHIKLTQKGVDLSNIVFQEMLLD